MIAFNFSEGRVKVMKDFGSLDLLHRNHVITFSIPALANYSVAEILHIYNIIVLLL